MPVQTESAVSKTHKVPSLHIYGFGASFFGIIMTFAMVSSYLPYFYTDVFLLPASVMGMLFLSCRIWDGITDPVVGLLVDSTNTRWGRFRPYLLFVPIPMAVFLGLTFYTPNLSPGWKIVWAFSTYFGLQMVKTAVAVPYSAIAAAITSNSAERAKISGIQQIFNSICYLVVGVATLKIVAAFPTERDGFFYTAAIFGAAAVPTLWMAFGVTKKYDYPEKYKKNGNSTTGADATKLTIPARLKLIFQNAPLFKLFLPITLFYIIVAMALGMGIYFFKYNLNMYDQIPIFNAAIMLSLMAGAAAAPYFVKKYEKIRLFQITNLLSVTCLFYVGWQAYTLPSEALAESWSTSGGLSFILINLSIFFGAFPQVIFPTMILDCVEYGEWKSGVNMAGLVNSTALIAQKAGMALGGLFVGIGLSLIHYVPNQGVYSREVLMGIAFLYLIFPGIARLLMSAMMLFYDLDESRHKQIVGELTESALNADCLRQPR